MEKTSFLFLANGFEEIETITVIDVLRRAEMPIKIISITESLQVKGAHGVVVTADSLFIDTDFSHAGTLILPGGMPGALNLSEFEPLNALLLKHFNNNEPIAAICASPAVVLAPLGILDGKKATCYPGFEDYMKKSFLEGSPVVVCSNLITANGPSAAMQFALAIVSANHGEDVAYDIASGMLLYPQHHKYFF